MVMKQINFNYNLYKMNKTKVKQFAKTILKITVDPKTLEQTFKITKYRSPIQPKVIQTKLDVNTFEYNFLDDRYTEDDLKDYVDKF